jgi:hypothetical protein
MPGKSDQALAQLPGKIKHLRKIFSFDLCVDMPGKIKHLRVDMPGKSDQALAQLGTQHMPWHVGHTFRNEDFDQITAIVGQD